MTSDATQVREDSARHGVKAHAQDVPPGYKRTEFGVIPADWAVRRLGNHVRFLRHGVNSRAELSSTGSVKYLHYGDIHTTTDVRLDPRLRSMPYLPTDRAGALDRLQDGDLVLVDASEDLDGVGKSLEITGVSDEEVVSGLHTIAARFDKSVIADGFKAYLQFCPQFRDHLKRLAAGTKVYATNRSHIATAEMPLPSVGEQRTIAEALSDVDGLLGALEALIAKKRAIKQAAMQQLLTGKSRLPGFSGEWETKRLGELGGISGAGVDKKTRPNEVPVRLLNYLDVYHKTFLRSIDLGQVVSAKPDHALRCRVLRGDVFFTPTSEVPDDIGRSAIAIEDIEDAAYSYHVVRLRLAVDWDLCFRAYVFNTKAFLDAASRACEGSGTRYVITLPRFRALPVRFPVDASEQAAIAAALSDMDAEITALVARREKTRAIQEGMMQQLLSGRVRLVTPETAANG